VALVELAAAAAEDLDRLIVTHSLPANTKERVKRTLKPLGPFPLLGAELPGRWKDFRFVLGPWRWMVIVYAYFEDEDRVVVVTILDGRSSAAPTRG
jgi:plasmid stabilization system protein ParE